MPNGLYMFWTLCVHLGEAGQLSDSGPTEKWCIQADYFYDVDGKEIKALALEMIRLL